MPRMTSLDRKAQILSYIVAYRIAHQYSPSVREIGQATGLASTSTVHGHLERLKRAGLIEQATCSPRTLRVLRDAWSQYPISDYLEQWSFDPQ